MAGQKIDIGIKTTADMTGAHAAKRSIEQLIVARKPLENVRSQFMSAREAEVAEVNRLAEGARKAKAPLENLNQGQQAVEKSTRNMGGAVLEASRAFEDAQYGIRGVLNNIPGLVMMLGGSAGVAGAASLAAVAISILGPKIAELMGAADDSQALADLDGLLGDVAQRMRDLAAERGRAQGQAWVDALDDEDAAIRRQNISLAAQVEILEARRLAQAAIDRADRERRKAEIDADPNRTDAQKIRDKGEIDSQGARADAEGQIIALKAGVDTARKEAQDKDAEAKRIADDLKAAQAEMQRLAAEKKEVDRSLRDLKNAEDARGGVEQRKKEFESERRSRLGFDTTADVSDLDAKIANLEMRLRQADDAPSKRPILTARQTELAEQITPVAGKVESLKQEEASAREAAALARDAAAKELALAREKQRGIIGEFQGNDAAARTSTEAAAREAERRAEDEKRRKEESAARKAKEEEEKKQRDAERQRDAQRDLEADIGGIGREAAEATAGLGVRGIDPRGFEKLAAKIAQRGDPKGDQLSASAMLDKLSAVIDAIPVSQQTSPDAEKLRQLEKKLDKKLADLKQYVINNLPTR